MTATADTVVARESVLALNASVVIRVWTLWTITTYSLTTTYTTVTTVTIWLYTLDWSPYEQWSNECIDECDAFHNALLSLLVMCDSVLVASLHLPHIRGVDDINAIGTVQI